MNDWQIKNIYHMTSATQVTNAWVNVNCQKLIINYP
jgi:hypothetical protein